MPIDVSHARTGYIFQLATTLPQLQKDVVHNFYDLRVTDPGTLPSKQAPFNHLRNRPFPSSPQPLHQSTSKCAIFGMVIGSNFYVNED